VSDDIPERREVIRSTVITLVLTVVFLILGLTFWAWSSPDIIEISPIGILDEMNPFVTILLESLTMVGIFIFLSVTVINLKLFISGVRAGWFEVIVVFIIVTAMAWLMFGSSVGGTTAILSLGFVVYLYWLQQ
jgi:hypothetical protein